MEGRRLANVQAGLRSFKDRGQDGESPVTLDWHSHPPELQIQALQAVQPLLRHLPFIELHVKDSQFSPGAAALAEALGATTNKLRLVLQMNDPTPTPGTLTSASGWLELLDALPHVKALQIMFTHLGINGQGGFPVYREGDMMSKFKLAVEELVTSAASACEHRGR
jgi:hypothetical protein